MELLQVQEKCRCLSKTNNEDQGRRQKRGAAEDDEDEEPAKKRGERMKGAEEGEIMVLFL